MKSILVSVLTFALGAGVATQADARSGNKKYKARNAPYAQQYAPREGRYPREMYYGNYAGYYEHRLDKVPFGTRLWWQVYEEQLPLR